ncbi:head-to-tail connector complex protein [Streptomyces phage Sycamore]|uniref:Head-to-tail connector complex protein n=1 Tax=Streptomyces phage Sycamore TaxID=2767589 RepID=A0A873WJ87_9CAUD|nr:head-to-tail connector complex protein [Streptomyces phage Sycamore]
MAALATVEDLQARMAVTFSDLEAVAAGACIDDVSALARLYGLPLWGTGTNPVPDVVRAVVLAVAERRMRNPEGYVSEMAGEYSYRLPEAGSAGMFFRPDELTTIRQAAGRTGLVSVPVTRPVMVAKSLHWPHGKDYTSGDF